MPSGADSGSLTNREKQLIRFMRRMARGELTIRVENGQPVLIYETVNTLKLEEKTALPEGNAVE
ncbi:hypothetical protein [Desulfoscipio geothermicus]|uniref:DUF2292 domain-containing protein n=1 Tax=Desulfoscipio geothermicus DSM 3669 TaxID=1121426 RepID=A0A1I6CN36_9FIRM|nr:hypothetical protein [Desulfoscipio geothermicus]SFQ94599.1 hypothetical protein SAMN05660706_1018 [Desulfoscipio geothermicus DSM 3669]